ncbi:MAG: amidohydrolase family protein, partial [Rhizobiaceae bacterium]|nr:amidohydrolase family protein [Hyphomicrobiales bacterium]NRB30038.1 amidohydrolase family protein [Rhizobiaceae bacterium]
GGTSCSMLRTMDEAYKILQLQNQNLNPLASFYMMTLGNAEALSLSAEIGTFAPGSKADICVMNSRATPGMALRMEAANSLSEELFVLQTMGDDRSISQVYVAGTASKPEAGSHG